MLGKYFNDKVTKDFDVTVPIESTKANHPVKFIPTTGYIQAFIIFVIISSHLSVFIEPVLMFLFHQKCLGRFRFWLFMIVFWCGFCQLETTASSIL